MQHFSKKEKILFSLALLAVVGVVISNINPSLSIPFPGNSERQILLKKKMISRSLQLLEQKEDILKRTGQYDKYVQAERTQEDELADFVKELEEIAQETTIEFVDLKTFSPERTDVSAEYKIEVEAEAQIAQLVVFMHNLQDSPNLLRIEKFRISPNTENFATVKTYLTITKMFFE